MANQDPENFVSLSDFMGLNPGEGDRMLNDTMQRGPGGGVSMDSIQHNADSHYSSAKDGPQDGGVFDRTGAAVKSGTASYGEFMQGLNDPEARQALLEKAYGGRGNGLDSALAGGGGGLGAANQNWGAFQDNINGQMQRAGDRKTDDMSMRKQYADQAAAAEAKRQSDLAAKNAYDKERLTYLSHPRNGTYGSEVNPTGTGAPGKATYDENGQRHNASGNVDSWLANKGGRNPDGTINYAKLNADWKTADDKATATKAAQDKRKSDAGIWGFLQQ